MRSTSLLLLMAVGLVEIVGAYAQNVPIEGMVCCNIPFTGQANGGELILADTLGRNARSVSIMTSPGESAESVAQRLADAINERDPFEWQHHAVAASEGTIVGLVGGCTQYITAGTETGLGIPLPPRSLTCNYDRDAGILAVRWQNASTDYDSVNVVYNYDSYNHTSGRVLPGKVEGFEINLNNPQISPERTKAYRDMVYDLDIWVSAVRNNIPSGAAGIHLNDDTQEEQFGIPFSNNTAPNWTKWSSKSEHDEFARVGTRQRLIASRENAVYNNVETPDQKPYYQILTSSSGAPAGITRSFLGLTPGHTYRVTIRMNTYGVKSKSSDWSYSFHAVPIGSEDRPLDSLQMSGSKSLPTKTKGFESSRAVKFDGSQRQNSSYRNVVKDITLPSDTDAIAVWLSFQSSDPNDYATMDYVKLEDLGMK